MADRKLVKVPQPVQTAMGLGVLVVM